MGKFQIEDKRQQEEIGEDPKKEESPLTLLNKCKVNQGKTFLKNRSLSQSPIISN